MAGLDHAISDLAGGGLAVGLLVAFLLGLRHATDPDHLTAVITLAAGEDRDGSRRAARLGLAWGLGHATTLLVLGLPVVVLHALIPASVQLAADVAVGAAIVALAVRLLVRWRRGYFHAHWHSHGDVHHSHPHMHMQEHGAGHPHSSEHVHRHRHDLVRGPGLAFGVGALHGAGGSAGVAILVVASGAAGAAAALALVVFALATAASMATVSAGFAWGMSRQAALTRSERLIPAIGLTGLVFGLSWVIAAL